MVKADEKMENILNLDTILMVLLGTRLDNLQAAIVNTKFKNLNKNIILRNYVARKQQPLKDLLSFA